MIGGLVSIVRMSGIGAERSVVVTDDGRAIRLTLYRGAEALGAVALGGKLSLPPITI